MDTMAIDRTLALLACLGLSSCAAPPPAPGPYPSVGALTIALPTVHRLCLGTLIAPDRVLTAAHCVSAKDPSLYRFVFSTEDGERAYRLKEVRIHPGFADRDEVDAAADDLAVVTLEEPVKGAPVELLPRAGGLDHAPVLRVVGYGAARSDGPASPLLRGADNDVLWLRPTEVAAGLRDQWQICHGDSGAPAFLDDEAGRRRLVGVVSRGIRTDCTSGAIFTRVDAFLDWIEQDPARVGG